MGRIIGIDYGQKRTGLAVTDPEQRIAGVLATVGSYELYQYLEKYLATEKVDGFVIGFPRDMQNRPSQSAQFVQAFAKGLERKFPQVPIYWVDERFTSKMAMQSMIMSGASKADRRSKENIDAVSAAIILESWLQMRMFKETH
jgi:putative Holliday junction resolvase